MDVDKMPRTNVRTMEQTKDLHEGPRSSRADEKSYLSRNVFERLYETQTNASKMKQNEGELPEGLKRTSSSFLEYSGNLTPSRFKSYTPAPRKISSKEKSPSGVRTGPGLNSTKQVPQPRKLDYRRTLKYELTRHSQIPTPSLISGKKKSQSQKLENADAKARQYAKSSLANGFSNADLPSFEEVLELFRHLDVGGKGLLPISELEKHLAKVYPGLRYRKLAVDSYGNKGGSLAEVDFPYFLLYVLYFNSVWDDFTLFEDDDEWRISKKEFKPVANKLGLFEDVEETWNSIHPDGEGFARLQAFCDACARKKLDLLSWDDQQVDVQPIAIQGKENVESGADTLDRGLKNSDSQDEPAQIESTGDETVNNLAAPANIPPPRVLMTTFDRYDQKKKGVMGLAQLGHLIASEYPELNKGSAVNRASAFADKDRDGYVTRDEFPIFCEYAVRYSSLWNQLGGGETIDAEISRSEAIKQVQRITGMEATDAINRMIGCKDDSVRLDDICAWCSSQVAYSNEDDYSNNDISEASSSINELLKTIRARHGGPTDQKVSGGDLPPMDVLMRIFDLIDVKGRRKVNFDQLDRYIKNYRPKWYYQPALEKGFALADRRESGYVRRHRFPVFYQFVSYHSKFLDGFKSRDDNINRSVRNDEFRAVAQRLGVTI